MENDSISSNVKMQIVAALIANCIIFSHGGNSGFFSPALPLLLSNNTPLVTGPLSTIEVSWIGSINSAGSVCGAFVYGFLSMCLGSKRSMLFLAFPSIIFWILIMFGHTFYHIFVARLIAGLLGGGFQSTVVVFLSEIANDNIRGRLGSIVPLARNTGLLMGFSIGAMVEYKYWPFIFIWIPVCYLVLILFLINTPQFYLQNGNYQKAKKALLFYKGWNENIQQQNVLIEREFERLKSIEEERKKFAKIQLEDFYNRLALKGIVISIAISWFAHTTGCYTMINYASYVFEKSGGSILSTNMSSIILAFVQIVGGLVSTQMGDTFGRKTTLAISLCGSIVGLISFAAYLHIRENGYDVTHFVWLPLTSLSLIIFVSSAGILALSNTCAIENFPSKIRSAGMIWYSFCHNTVAFTTDKFFPILHEIIHLKGVLLVFAFSSCMGLIFIFLMTETKGQPLDALNSNGSDSHVHAKNKLNSISCNAK